MKLFSNNKEYFEKLVKVIILSVAEDGGSDCAATISSAVVNWVLQRDGIQRAKETYKRYVQLCFLRVTSHWRAYLSLYFKML